MAGMDITLQNNSKTKKLYPRTFLRNVYMEDGVTTLPSVLSGITTNSATAIQVTMDETSYVATINLLNEKGMIISTSSIDLPLESMLIDCDYQDGKLIMMLQTGKIVEVEMSDLVKGLVHESRTINGKPLMTDIELNAQDVGALPADTQYVSSINGESGALDDIAKLEDLPTKVSELDNDSNFVTEARVSEMIASADVDIDLSGYSKTDHTHSEYAPFTHTHSIYSPTDHTHTEYAAKEHDHEGMATETFVTEKISAIPTPDVSGQINTHNTSNTAHADIRDIIDNHNHDSVYSKIHEHPYAAEGHGHDNYLPLTAGEGKILTGVLHTRVPSSVWSTDGGIYAGLESYIVGNTSGEVGIKTKAGTYIRTGSTTQMAILSGLVRPGANGTIDLGNSTYKWKEIHGTTIYQNGKQVANAAESGYSLSIEKDETNFTYTLHLKNKEGTSLSTQTIDLPLESVVVNGSYSNGTLTLKLKNSEKISIDISDMISGLVPDSITINGKPLSSNITLTASDVGALPSTAQYVSSIDGKAGAITGIAKTSDLPTITQNGSVTTTPNFYAPTGAGTSGYLLKSNGSGAPTWVAQDTITANTAKTLATSRTINGTSFNGSADIITDYSYNISFDRITATSVYYAIFASISSSNLSSNYGASFIVSGLGNTSDKSGSYLVEVGGRSGTPFIRAQEIVSGSSSIQFGYYLSGTTYYFGVKCPASHSKITITVLNKDGVTTGALSNTTTAPSGWTAGTLTQFSISSHTHADYLPLTAGSSKKLTGTLYADTGGIVVGQSSSANNTMGILFGTATSGSRIGANINGVLGIYASTELYLRPGVNTDASAGVKMTRTDLSPTTNKSMSLGTSSYNYNNIYGTTIYEAGTALSSKYAAKSHNHVKADITDFDHTHNNYLLLDGSSRMTGVLKLQANMYDGNYALDCANSSITGVNSIYLADSDNGQGTEGLVSPRSDNTLKWDSISLYNGVAYLTTNMTSLQSGGGTRSQLATVNDTVANATKLNNQEASYYLNYNNFTNKPSIPSFSALGSATQPVYLSGTNTFTACSTYTGGTAVTLNGSSKGASTASFYAPTSAGTSGYQLKSNGSGAPTWARHYWADIAISTTSSTTTAPTFASVTLGSSGAKIAYNTNTQSIDFTF